jgi:type III secretory pathway component EscS
MLQAITQVQEQSISHLARLVAISVVLVWGGQRAFGEIERMFVAVITRVGEARLP